jgi:hypothetical protein
MKTYVTNRCAMWCAALAAISVARSAWARDCPTDLAPLGEQLRAPEMKPALSISIDQLVASAGGVDQAIRGSKVELLCFMNAKTRITRQTRRKDAQKIDDAILVTNAVIKALECRKTSP